MLKALLIIIFLIPTVFAQDELPVNEEDSNWKLIQIPFNYQNMQVPRELWENIKQILKNDGVNGNVVDDFAVLPINFKFQIASTEKNVLKEGKNYQLAFVEGGGNVDLFDYVSGKGAFYLKFSPEFQEVGNMHMLYISDSPGKDVGGDQWGNGCGKIFDLTEKSGLFTGEQGMKVTSARRHYMHLMAGTYVFFQLIEEKMFLGYIRLQDSRYPNFKCGTEV